MQCRCYVRHCSSKIRSVSRLMLLQSVQTVVSEGDDKVQHWNVRRGGGNICMTAVGWSPGQRAREAIDNLEKDSGEREHHGRMGKL